MLDQLSYIKKLSQRFQRNVGTYSYKKNELALWANKMSDQTASDRKK
jgi:hypothetical protein